MKETYQIVSIKDGKQDLAAILQTFQDIKAGLKKNDLRLINYYHEVPVSYPVTIEGIEQDTVDLKVHQAQAMVLAMQRQTLIKSSAFPQGLGVHAMVEHNSVSKCITILGRFAYASIRAERRESVRVTIGEKTDAEYQAEDQSIEGELRDISLTGFALHSSKPLPTGIKEEGIARIPLGEALLVLPARLITTIHKDDGYLYAFNLDVDKQADKIISHYIYNRQVEIIRNLKEQFG